MKIEDIELTNENAGDKVTYIPPHAKNAGSKYAENGVISSWNNSYVFVEFGTGTVKACDPDRLVWG